MKAVLWDNYKQINGSIVIDNSVLSFLFFDFIKTNLSLVLQLHEVKKIKFLKLYNITSNALEIETFDGRQNVFVLEEPKLLKRTIENLLNEST